MFDLRLENGNPDSAARQIGDEQTRDQNLTGTNSSPVARPKRNRHCDREQHPRGEHEQRSELRRLAQMLRDQARVCAGAGSKSQPDQVRG